MTTSRLPEPPFGTLLERIEDRSAALRTAAGKAGARARVPGCPDWAVADLVAHLGGVQRFWAAAVAAGRPAADAAGAPPQAVGLPPDEDAVPGREPPRDPGELLAWSAESTLVLIDALRAAGPDTVCWTWWAESGNPSTSWAVARHQVQEAAVHARDAQEAADAPEAVPREVALDGVDEFLHVGLGSMDGWPHSPARVAVVADEGPAWTLILDGTGASAIRRPPGEGPQAGATLSGSASDLLLGLYRRVPLGEGALRLAGDSELARQLVVWSPLG